MEEQKEFYTIMEFSNKMRWHPNTVRKMIKTGRIQAVRSNDGKKASYRIKNTEVDRLCELDMSKLIEKLIEEKMGERKV